LGRLEELQLAAYRGALRLGGALIVVGSLAVFAFRLAHGDLPAADPEAALQFISERPYYAAIHIGTIFGVLAWAGGFILLSTTLERPLATLLSRLGAASVLVGAAIFIVDFVIDGVAGQDLAAAWTAASPAARANLVLAAHTADTMIRGTSLISIVILWGLPLLLFGRAVMLEDYPAWLGWTGMVVGVVTILGATALLLQSTLFPGVVVYGPLASIAVQLWSLVLGVVMWRRAGTTPGPVALGAAGRPLGVSHP
jgi:hypothetical protein